MSLTLDQQFLTASILSANLLYEHDSMYFKEIVAASKSLPRKQKVWLTQFLIQDKADTSSVPAP